VRQGVLQRGYHELHRVRAGAFVGQVAEIKAARERRRVKGGHDCSSQAE
jgi:hypothetical protein